MSKQLSFIVVDDEEIGQVALKAQAVKFPFFSSGRYFSQSLEAAEFINRFQPDIVFADIEMPVVNGLQLIRGLDWQPPAVVFITSHPEFALEGFDMNVFDYLVKPIDTERFALCANRLHDFFSMRAKAAVFDREQESGCIVIKQGYDKFKIKLTDIQYVEAMKDYVRIVSPTATYLVLETMTHMQERLSALHFVRIHRSYLVNKTKISAVSGNKITVGKVELPVGKLFKHSLDNVL